MNDHVVIAGAGLVGSLAAVYLARRGYKVDVYERGPDLRRRRGAAGKSINLTLCDRGYRALDRVGAGDGARRLAIPAYGRIIHGLDGTTTFQPYGNCREAIHSISRNALNRVLLDFAEQQSGVTLHFEEKCVAIDPDVPRLRLRHAATGREQEVSPGRLIGADGAYSAVRRRLQKKDRFDYSQFYVRQGYKELHLPASEGRGFQLEKNALHIWPRGLSMLIGFANTDGSFTLALHLPFEGERSFDTITSEDDLLALFRELFPGTAELMPSLVEDYFGRPAMSMVTIRCFPWFYRDKVALLGDAAHAIVPSYGQGANCGFEDCAALADCLRDAGDDWATALPEYQRRRKADADAISEMALEHFDELQDHLGNSRFLLRKRLERRIDELYPQTYSSLYSLITFTDLPYTEARRLGAERQLAVDRLLEAERAEAMLESGEIDCLIHQAFAGLAQTSRPGKILESA